MAMAAPFSGTQFIQINSRFQPEQQPHMPAVITASTQQSCEDGFIVAVPFYR